MVSMRPFPNRRTWSKALGEAGLALVISLGMSGIVVAQTKDHKPNEYEVKAVYLYNFGKFVRWPSAIGGTREPFAICILGEDPFGPALDTTVAGETIDGANITTARISRAEDAGNCRIVFISSSEAARMKQILFALNRSSVLTVSDLPQFSQQGGMIEFVFDGKKIRFEVNLTPAERARLTFSSELLKLAANIRKNNGPGD